ncbi:glycoside hydrolase family 16 protein [Vibrio sp. YMD68]|uniref:glycoside hydrolase family 16 protein n=1 Tax=Vibrio sp. YMD68 TaxID=3042300 RepID=UPI00249A453B|nr:glycoside hydrolase family 16 protein [Vibrio sp. YMD68]WGV98440.1 glycoside hydrolase family 16 protein [Vibrio sp. YMD68]
MNTSPLNRAINMFKTLSIISLLLFNTVISEASECDRQDYELVWADEFDYLGLPDDSRWNYEEGYVRNKELQYYQVKSLENTYVQNGMLTIEARRDSSTLKPYTSASITTENRATWKYGKIEVRASIPIASGTWPAIWMLGANIRQVYWPRSGEIDIMEHVGSNPNFIHGNAIYYDYETNANGSDSAHIAHDSVNSFNRYAIEWTQQHITYFINDKPFHQFDINTAGNKNNPFHKPFYLIINLALGGWGGELNDDFTSEKLKIDYVRVYQKFCHQ